MARWNQFSDEVARERQTVRNYGVDRVNNRVPAGDSYKAQALREMALRLELENEIERLKAELASLVDRVESLETT